MTKIKIITREEAEHRFNAGHAVGIRAVDSLTTPVWQHVADGFSRTFDQFASQPRWWGEIETEFLMPGPRKETQVEAAGHIFRREPFEIGNISGTRHFLAWATRGDLPEKYRKQFDKADYAVWSYETPIAWVERESGLIVIPPVRYSNTTTQHQYLAARAFDVPFRSTESAREGKGKTPYTPRKGW